MQALQIFRDVARARSFSRGASANGVSQSAASQAISQLEKHLEVQLIDRSTRPLLLTPAGQVFYDGCRSLLDRYDALESEVRSYPREGVITLRIAAIYSIGLHHLPAYIERFSATDRNVQVRIECLHPDRVYASVLNDESDIGLVSYARPDRRLSAIAWQDERMVVVCPTGDALTHRDRLEPSDLVGRRFVAFDRNLPIRQAMDRYLRRQHIAVEIALEFDNIESIKQAVISNTGLSILPEPTVRTEVEQNRLSVLPINGDGLVRPLAIIHRRGKKVTPTVSAFIDLLCDKNPEPQSAVSDPAPPTFRGDPEGSASDTLHTNAKHTSAKHTSAKEITA